MLGALGAGLLTGTALAVILPEGFHAFQAAQDATGQHCKFHEHLLPAAHPSGPAVLVMLLAVCAGSASNPMQCASPGSHCLMLPTDVVSFPLQCPVAQRGALTPYNCCSPWQHGPFSAYSLTQRCLHADEALPDWAIGAVLVAGFLGMLLLDQLQHRVGGPHVHGHAHGRGALHARNSDEDLEDAISATIPPARTAGKVSFACHTLVR